jgi:predicted ATPase/class 3 adenylate cyclase
MACEVCRQDLPAGAVVCPVCGGVPGSRDGVASNDGLNAAAARGERRQVTALFCDLVDSVPLTVRLDPEDLMLVIDAYLAVCNRVLQAHGGTIVQYMGDGVLAYFGYPQADEDDAANAVRAGLALRDAVAALPAPPGITLPAGGLQVRVGIATGLVAISDPAARSDGRKAGIVGPTPNLAARLQSAARPGGVVVARATYRATSGMFVYRPLGEAKLKGFAVPEETFEALEEDAAAGRFRTRTQDGMTRLVGRDQELAQLLTCWKAACAGNGRVVLLRGEAGIGKSRLVEELRGHAADTVHTPIAWYCGPTHSDTALRPVMVQVAKEAGFTRDDGAAARREKLDRLTRAPASGEPSFQAVLADLFEITGDAPSPLAGVTREKRKDVILETLLGMALGEPNAPHPTLLLLEDAHWADSTTLELAGRAASRVNRHRCLVVVTARAGFVAPWEQSAAVTCIEINRLAARDAERICDELGATARLPQATVRQIIARGDGNPLFVQELTRAVLETAAADGGGQPVSVPESLHDTLVARLDRLGPARRIANLGAAIGRRFSYRLLAAMVQLPDNDLRLALVELTRSGLVEISGVAPNSVYAFKHALIRDAAYHSLLKRERQALHTQIAAGLSAHFGGLLETEPELLAYHLTESGDGARAIPLWAQAGERAAGNAAHVEAAAHLQTALDLARQLPLDAVRVGMELRLLIGLAVSLAASRGNSVPEVAQVLAQARAICDALADTPEIFAVLRATCSFAIVANDLRGAEDLADRCLTIGLASNRVDQQIEANHALGYILSVKGELAKSRLHLERAITLYDENGGAAFSYPSPHDPLSGSLAALALLLHAVGDDAGAAREASRLVLHSTAVGGTYTLAFGLAWRANLELRTRDFAAALHYADEAIAVCERYGYTSWEIFAKLMKASAIGSLGRAAEGLELAQLCIEELDRFGNVHGRGFALGELAGLQAGAGELQMALRSVDQAIATVRADGECYSLSPLYQRRADILARLPGADPAEITACLRAAIAIAEGQGAFGFVQQAAALLPCEVEAVVLA